MTDIHTTSATEAIFRPYLPRLVLDWAQRAPETPARVVDASLLGLDISGFTALSERLAQRGKLGAEELIALISRSYSGLIEIGARYGGDTLKFRGDALLLLFEGDEHERRAVQAAIAMQALVARADATPSTAGPVTLGMAAGISSGPTHLFLLGKHHHELVLCGPNASATLQLEDAAERGEILMSARTAEAVPHLQGARRGDAFLVAPDVEVSGIPAAAHELEPSADPSLYIPARLRAAIAADAVEAEHRHAVAAFVKFSGTDALVEDLAEATASLAALADVVSDVTDELGITWLESDIDDDGGKLYLVAGAPGSAGGDEERMLRAARAILDAHVGPPIAIGMNRGPVVAGPIGAPTRKTYAVMGDTVNLAARLAARAAKGEILATGDVLQRSRARFATTSRQFLMKGKEKPVTGYSVGALEETAAVEQRARLPIVGRDDELSVLRQAVEAARVREARAIELIGDPGIGKSRLVEELPTIALGFQLLQARCEEYASSTPFAPFRTLLRPLVGITPDEPPEEAGAKLTVFVQQVMPDLAPWLPLLAVPFDATVSTTAEVDEVDPAFRRSRLHDVVDMMLMRLLLMPTVIVVEDAHWLDDASQLLLRRLMLPAPRPWLVCVTRRRHAPALGGDETTMLELAPLDAVAARALALASMEGTALPEQRLADITQQAGGNPLFVLELAASGGGELPESIESLLTARLDTLEPSDRQLLRHAAVIGRAFDLDLLAEILPDEDGADPDRWERLAGFVEWQDTGTFVFSHDLVRAAAYEGLSYAVRREIHGRVGGALERRAGDAADIAPLLSLHFFEAGEFDRAWGYAVAAGDDARAKYANVDAAILYTRALAAADELTPSKEATSVVAEALGDVCEVTASYAEAAAAYERAAADATDRTSTARLLRKRGTVEEELAHYDDALARYDEALALGDDVAQPELVEVENATATVLYRQGKIEQCIEWCERAAARAMAASDQRGLAHAYYVRAAAEGNRSGPARHFLELALPIYEEIGDLVRTSMVLMNMGVPAYYAGEWADALRCYRQGAAMARRAGYVVGLANATNNEAEILLDQGRVDESRALLEEALRTYRAAGFAMGEALATANVGRAAALGGDFRESTALLASARELFEAMGAESFAFTARSRQAEALVLEGHHRAALDLAAETLAVSRAAGEHGTLTAQLERVLGYAYVQARDAATGRPHFESSLAVARETGAAYEEALTIKALADAELVDESERDRATEIFEQLGVVSLPYVPLP